MFDKAIFSLKPVLVHLGETKHSKLPKWPYFDVVNEIVALWDTIRATIIPGWGLVYTVIKKMHHGMHACIYS
jgi:hypothetical protein